MAKRKVKSYPESFRKEAVRLANLQDRTAVDVAKELGLHVVQIYNWKTQFSKLSKKQFKIHEGVDYSKEEKEELRRLKRENARLRKERDFLKKALAVSCPQSTLSQQFCYMIYTALYPLIIQFFRQPWCSVSLLELSIGAFYCQPY